MHLDTIQNEELLPVGMKMEALVFELFRQQLALNEKGIRLHDDVYAILNGMTAENLYNLSEDCVRPFDPSRNG